MMNSSSFFQFYDAFINECINEFVCAFLEISDHVKTRREERRREEKRREEEKKTEKDDVAD